MEYKKVIDLLDNTSNRPSKFRTKNQVEINNDARDYSYAYIPVSESVTID